LLSDRPRMTEALVARVSVNINASRAKVWDALVTPGTIKQYMPVTDVDSDWHEGSPIVWRSEVQSKPFEIKGTVLRLEAGRLLEGAALALGRAACAALADEDAWHPLHHRDGRTVVDQACRRHGSADPLVDDRDHLEDARAFHEGLDTVADLHRGRRFGRGAVHA